MVKTSDISIFDRARIEHNRVRSRDNFANHDFLFQWSKKHLLERLSDINRNFPKALHIGSRGAIHEKDHQKIGWISHLDLPLWPIEKTQTPYICATEEFLPIAPKSLDLITSNLNLHSVNDLPGTLLQSRQSLKDDGLFLAAMLGGETLHEFRHVLMETEMEVYGGASPRIFPFADKPQMGDLLQRAGFSLPVVDSDVVTATYDDIFKLMSDLRGMGEGNAIIERSKQPLGKSFFMRAAQKYQNLFCEDDGRIFASFEVIFLLGWAPHSSQQKPLRPGSAKHSLAKALGANEIKIEGD